MSVCTNSIHVHLYLKWLVSGKISHHHHNHHYHLSINLEGCWGTADDFVTSFLHFYLFSTAFWDLANFRPVLPLMLSSHLFLCLPCLLPFFTVPCKVILARPDERETCPYHFCLRLFTMVRGVLVWSDCLLDRGTDFLVGNMAFA